jgi:hypothetical protein
MGGGLGIGLFIPIYLLQAVYLSLMQRHKKKTAPCGAVDEGSGLSASCGTANVSDPFPGFIPYLNFSLLSRLAR